MDLILNDNKIPSKIDNVDLLRVFGIGIVVLRHCFMPFTGSWGFDDLYPYSNTANIFGKYISTISMPLFTFISGFIYSYLRNYLHKYSSYSILIKKKIKRLVVPYLIISPLYIYFFLEYNSAIDFLKYLWTGGAGHLWFLSMIFTVFLVFYPLEPYLRKNIKWGIILVLFLFSLNPITWYIGIPVLAKFFKYLPFFYLGYLFYYKNKLILKYINGKFWYFFLLHLLLFFGLLYLPNYIENRIINILIAHFKLIPLGFLSITFIFISFNKLDRELPNKFRLPVKFINKNSYYIYLIHQPLLILLFELKFMQSLPALAVIIISFTFSFIISLALGEVIMKFKIGRIIIGAETNRIKLKI